MLAGRSSVFVQFGYTKETVILKDRSMITKHLPLIVSLLAALGLLTFFIINKQKRSAHIERTFAIIKPDAVAEGNAAAILGMIKEGGFTIVAQKEATLSKEQAESFYAVHKEKPFFSDLVQYITSGPVILLVLEKENGIKAWRDLMGATNPEKAVEGTIRHRFGKNIQQNAVHGSDSIENAKKEIAFFFPTL